MHKIVNGIKVELSAEEIGAVEEERKRELDRISVRDSFSYIKNRKESYPSIEDQLDLIYHKGVDAWKAEIRAVKDKYPKPSND